MSTMSRDGNATPTTESVNYEQIRVLGRGAFGEAVLYRKIEVLSLSIFCLHYCWKSSAGLENDVLNNNTNK